MKHHRRKEVDLEGMVLNGQEAAYEALQLYKSKCNRLQLKEDYSGAAAVASTGSIAYITNGYFNAAEELWKIYFDALSKSNIEFNQDVRTVVDRIISAYGDTNDTHKMEFLQYVLKYSIDNGTLLFGNPEIQSIYAACLWKNEEYRKSVKHFVLGEAPQILYYHVCNS
jgi:hypothetical protein